MCNAFPYIGDIAVFSLDRDSHIKHLDAVLRRLGEVNLKKKSSKCRFTQDHIKFLEGKGSSIEAKSKE